MHETAVLLFELTKPVFYLNNYAAKANDTTFIKRKHHLHSK